MRLTRSAAARHRKSNLIIRELVQMRLTRSGLRGRKKVQAQWQLFATVHNIEKLIPKIG
jgi:hypothetical protein